MVGPVLGGAANQASTVREPLLARASVSSAFTPCNTSRRTGCFPAVTHSSMVSRVSSSVTTPEGSSDQQ